MHKLSDKPTIHALPTSHPGVKEAGQFYIDDYTGKPIRVRVGLPAVIACPERVRRQQVKENVICGAFETFNVLMRYLVDLKEANAVTDVEWEAASSWVYGMANKQTVIPALHFSKLSVFGGSLDYGQYDRESPHVQGKLPQIEVEKDVDARQVAAAEVKAEREEKKKRTAPQKSVWAEAARIAQGDIKTDAVCSLQVEYFPALDYWCVSRAKSTEEYRKGLRELEDELGVVLPSVELIDDPQLVSASGTPESVAKLQPKHVSRLKKFIPQTAEGLAKAKRVSGSAKSPAAPVKAAEKKARKPKAPAKMQTVDPQDVAA